MRSFFPALILSVLLFSCGNNKEKTEQQTYEQQKESLQDKEKKHPLKFLGITGDDKKNIIGQTVVRGKISNKATVSSYKDIRIKMLCYKDGAMVEEHEDTIDEIIIPNSTKDFKTKYRLPKGTDSIALSIMNASVAETK